MTIGDFIVLRALNLAASHPLLAGELTDGIGWTQNRLSHLNLPIGNAAASSTE